MENNLSETVTKEKHKCQDATTNEIKNIYIHYAYIKIDKTEKN